MAEVCTGDRSINMVTLASAHGDVSINMMTSALGHGDVSVWHGITSSLFPGTWFVEVVPTAILNETKAADVCVCVCMCESVFVWLL